MALQMANLNDTIDQIYDFSCWRANVYELNRLLAQTKMRYSDELTSILQRMLFFDESHRIDMNQLIDLLTPVLEANLEQWEAIFSVADKHSVSSSDQ
jgi:replication-associated recombination protein RarA